MQNIIYTKQLQIVKDDVFNEFVQWLSLTEDIYAYSCWPILK